MLKYFIIFILVFLSSCSSARLRMLENSGAIRTDFSEDPDYDYTVLIEGTKFMGFDGNNQADRQNILKSMFGDRCKQLKLGDEVSKEVGSAQNGNPTPTWLIKVKCLN